MTGKIISLTIFAVIFCTPPVAAEGRGEACARLGDVIRQAVDQIVAGDQSARVQTALEAHTRLNCPVNALLNALRIPTLSDAEAAAVDRAARDSDRQPSQ